MGEIGYVQIFFNESINIRALVTNKKSLCYKFVFLPFRQHIYTACLFNEDNLSYSRESHTHMNASGTKNNALPPLHLSSLRKHHSLFLSI